MKATPVEQTVSHRVHSTVNKSVSSKASKKLSTRSLSKNSPPFKMADDADRSSVAAITGIQRPKPLNDCLIIPVLGNKKLEQKCDGQILDSKVAAQVIEDV